MPYLTQLVGTCNFRNMMRRNFSKCVHQVSKALCPAVQVSPHLRAERWIKATFQIKDLQKLMPNFSYQFVEKGPSAVQCQLLNADGSFVDDFVFEMFKGTGMGPRVANLKFTPSPAATSCMPIADLVSQKFKKKLQACEPHG